MLDSWEICQPSAWAFQTMPHNVLDSPEKQPGAWKLPAHHRNSLIWALWLSVSFSLTLCVRSSLSLSLCISFSLLIHPPSSHLLSQTQSLKSLPSTLSFFPFPVLGHITIVTFFFFFLLNPSQKLHVIEWSTCFSKLFPCSILPQLLHPVKQHQMPLIRS